MLKRMTMFFSIIPFCVGAVGIIGWILHVNVLTRINEPFIPIAPATAIIFTALSITVVLYEKKVRTHIAIRFYAVLSIMILSFCCIILIDFFTGMKIGIEDLITHDVQIFDKVTTGRMSPVTSGCFILSCSSILILLIRGASKRAKTVAALLAGTGSFIGFVVLVGYLYDVPLLYGGTVIPVALPTAIALLFSGLSLITLAGEDVWPVHLFIGSSVKTRLFRSFLPFILIVIILDEFLDKFFSINFQNPALTSSLLLIGFLVIMSLIISRLSNTIGGEIERLNVERMKAEKALREDKERLGQITSSLREVVWLRDAKSLNILYVNPAFEKIFGRTCDTFYKNPDLFIDIIYPEDKERVLDAMKKYEGGEPFLTVYRITHTDGDVRWIADRTIPIKDNQGEVFRVAVISEDITDRRNSDEKLRYQKEELQIQNEELDAFAHTVAHDLKNPIGLIMSYTELLMEDDPEISESARHECMKALRSSAKKSLSIIDELLVLAETRHTEVSMNPVNINENVYEVQKRLSKIIGEMNAEIKIQSSMPKALGHAPWIEEVMINYMSNALKYGGRPPRIEIGYDIQSENKIRYWVKDNGNGLSKEEESKLFTPFTRLGQIKFEGHGLGLSIVQRIIEKLGGEVGVESEVGKGSTFYFTLPQA